MKTQLRLNPFSFLLAFILLWGCSTHTPVNESLSPGSWIFQLQLKGPEKPVLLPFNVEVYSETHLLVKNASEKINVTEIFYKDDSLHIVMPVFGSEFKGKITSDTLRGYWYKYATSREYKIPFIGFKSSGDRFDAGAEPAMDFSGRWKSNFISNSDTSTGIGIFGQSDRKITGTFLTETGDYRFLEGIVDGNRVMLSAFDGAHAFLFQAEMNDEGMLNGIFRSGPSWEAKWTASKDDGASLRDMKTLTYLKEGYEKLAFSFPDEEEKLVSLDDERFRSKVVIVQIFGTWCPNCMDETRYLVDLYNKYNSLGLEIIGLDFEPKPVPAYFKNRMKRYRQDLNVPYTLLLAGSSDKEKAAEALPMLNQILSFPTTIIIDKTGEIREIHTGFTGPGTGSEYENYSRETEQLIQGLLKE